MKKFYQNQIVILFVGLILASYAKAVSLDEAIRRAVNIHPDVHAARANLKIARGEKQEAFSAYFPSIEVGIDMYRKRTKPRAQESLYTSHSSQFISVRQILFSGFQTVYDNQAAAFREEAAKKSIESTKSFTALTVVSNYFFLLAALKRDQYTYEATELVHQIMTEAQARHTACNRQGITSTAAAATQQVENCDSLNEAFLEAQQRWFAYRSLRVGTRHDLEDNYNGLNLLVSNAVDSSWKANSEGKYTLANTYQFPSNDRFPRIPRSEEEVLQAFRSRNPALLAARRESEAAAKDIQSKRAEYMPRVEAYVFGEREDFHNKDARVVHGIAGMRVTLPLDFGGVAGRSTQAHGKYELNQARVTSLLQESERSIRRWYSILNSTPERINIMERSLLSAHDLLEKYQKNYFSKAAGFDVVYLLDTIDRVYGIQTELEMARTQGIYAHYEIASWSGDLLRELRIQ